MEGKFFLFSSKAFSRQNLVSLAHAAGLFLALSRETLMHVRMEIWDLSETHLDWCYGSTTLKFLIPHQTTLMSPRASHSTCLEVTDAVQKIAWKLGETHLEK